MKLKELFEQQNDVLSYFNPEDISTHNIQKWKSRDKMIMMPIDDFLNMASPGMDDEKAERVKQMIANGAKFSIPSLSIDYLGDNAKVVGHEGRHRARALKQLGYDAMPVILNSDAIRWSEQINQNSFDYLKAWPEVLVSQKGNTTIPFPVARENADDNFMN